MVPNHCKNRDEQSCPDGSVKVMADSCSFIDEQKLKDLRGDELRKMNQNGMLPLIHAHMFSLQLMRELFSRQVQLGKMPQVTEAPQV